MEVFYSDAYQSLSNIEDITINYYTSHVIVKYGYNKGILNCTIKISF